LHSDKDQQIPFVGGPNTYIKNPRWRTAAILEKSKNRHISAAVSPMSTKFGSDAVRPFLSRPTVKISKNLKIHDSGDRHLEKSKYRYILVMVGPIATKFGTLTQFDTLDHSVSKSAPVVARFDWFMRSMSPVHFQKHSLYRMTR